MPGDQKSVTGSYEPDPRLTSAQFAICNLIMIFNARTLAKTLEQNESVDLAVIQIKLCGEKLAARRMFAFSPKHISCEKSTARLRKRADVLKRRARDQEARSKSPVDSFPHSMLGVSVSSSFPACRQLACWCGSLQVGLPGRCREPCAANAGARPARDSGGNRVSGPLLRIRLRERRPPSSRKPCRRLHKPEGRAQAGLRSHHWCERCIQRSVGGDPRTVTPTAQCSRPCSTQCRRGRGKKWLLP